MFKGLVLKGRQITDPEAVSVYNSLSVLESGLHITKYIKTGNGNFNKSSEITISQEEIYAKEQLLGIYENQFGDFVVCDMDKISYSSFGLSLVKIKAYKSELPIMLIYGNGSDYGVISYSDIVTDMEIIKEENANIPGETFKLLFGETCTEFFKVRRSKRSLISQIELSDSLTFLEAQVDLLSKVVFAIADAHPEVLSSLHYNQIKNTIESNSVLTVKTETKCLSDIKEGKSVIRKLQADYFAVKEEF